MTITAEDIVNIIAVDDTPVLKVGSIVRCRYCRKFSEYQPNIPKPFEAINHYSSCVWELSNALVRLRNENIKVKIHT